MLPDNIKPAIIYGLLGVSLALNLVMVMDRDESAAAPELPEAVEPAPAEPAAPSADAGASALAAAPAPVAAAPALAPTGAWKVLSSEVNGSVSRTFNEADPEHGDALAQTYARLFVWDIDMRRDLQRGDRVEVAYRVISDAEIEIAAAKLHSQKHGKVIAAYRWQAPGDAFASYWHEDGLEIPYRLKSGPINDYEQITSLLKDRPTHEGMDFKTPTGTPILSPKAGTVTRVNWNWSGNGNCVEVRFQDGVMAKFLHLSENQVAAGDTVSAGQQIALSGNTGHSTAPHLHYQLSRGDQILDPIDYHGAERRKLTPEAMTTFTQEMARLDAELGSAVATR